MQALRELLGASFLVAGLCEAGPEGCVGWPTSVGQASEGQSLSCWPDPAPPASQRPANPDISHPGALERVRRVC